MKQARRKILLSVSIHPEWGSYIHICQAVRYSQLNRRQVTKLFNEFMGEEEYDVSEKSECIDYLITQSVLRTDDKIRIE